MLRLFKAFIFRLRRDYGKEYRFTAWLPEQQPAEYPAQSRSQLPLARDASVAGEHGQGVRAVPDDGVRLPCGVLRAADVHRCAQDQDDPGDHPAVGS